jgi:transcription elongation GreA/GreB family factor
VNKAELKAELIAKVEAEVAALVASHEATLAGATHEEAKPENDKDTRAVEQQYLARGQAARVADAEAGLLSVRAMELRGGPRAAVGTVLTIEDEDGERGVLIAPYGGGMKLAAGKVQVVTPQAPLGRALLGKIEGDEVEVKLGPKARNIVIVGVQ